MPRQGSWLGLSVAMLFTVCSYIARPVAGAEATQASGQISPAAVSPAERGPEQLKKEVWISVETNAPPAAGSAPKEKSSYWRVTWKGWNGLHYELSHK